MGNKNTHVANVSGPDQMNKRVRFGVCKHANEKLSVFDFDENDVSCEQFKEKNKSKKLKGGTKRKRSSSDDQDGKKKKVRKVVGRDTVSKEATTQLKEFIDEVIGSDMKLVIQKTLFQSDLKRSQNRLNMPFKQVETHDFLTDEEIRFLGNDGIEVRLVGPNLQMFMKPMRLTIWNMSGNKNYVLKTNWCDFVEANKMVLKERATIQVWSFRKDAQLCFAVVCVVEPNSLEDASSSGSSLSS